MKHNRLILLLVMGISLWLFFHLPRKTIYFPSFEEAQGADHYSPADLIQFHQRLSKKKWKILHRLYKRNLAGYQRRHKKERIPKILHQIWLEGPIPENIAKLQESWMQFHPDWDYHLWTKDEVALLYLHNKDLYDFQENLKIKEEILRLEILYQFGGVVVDNDFACIQPVDILHETCDFYAPLTDHIRNPQLSCDLIAASPKHPIIHTALRKLERGPIQPLNDTFTSSFFEAIKKSPSQTNLALPVTFFYASPSSLEKRGPKPYTFAFRKD